ncbi:hypothetical protein RND81_08G163900 [Saponaria officinalis]|uniref:Dolichyl-diphosphooligosaccharide--protein glycosyltransferase subunit DAD1 n=1 Tax=Saponaria officinalis TaxID=3572 RepID=A0AAW1J8I4_SAPOF
MGRSTSKDAQALFQSLRSAYAATPTNLKIIDLYIIFAVSTALIQVAYMATVGSFPFNSFLSGVLSCVGTAVLAVCLRIQVNKENKEFKEIPGGDSNLRLSSQVLKPERTHHYITPLQVFLRIFQSVSEAGLIS